MSDDHRWRVGHHYGLHVYWGDVPVATFHDADDAAAAVDAHNLMLAQSKDDLDLTTDDFDTLMEHGEPVEIVGPGTFSGGKTVVVDGLHEVAIASVTKERDAAVAAVVRVRAVIAEAIVDADQERMGTHWPGCHRVHHDCLAVAIREALEQP